MDLENVNVDQEYSIIKFILNVFHNTDKTVVQKETKYDKILSKVY